MSIITIKDAEFSYEDIPVISQGNLQIEEGDFAVLIGENGAGKSTLLKLILGELTPTRGEIRIFDEDPEKVFKKYQIGYVPQNSIALNQGFPATVEEIVLTGLYREIGRLRLPKAAHRKKAAEMLKQMKMEEYQKSRIGELSGGQQQRVMLARALVGGPSLLILDEPTTGMDTKSVEEFYEILEHFNHKQNLTILMVTHGALRECRGINRVFQMKEGQVTEG
jgi:zinc transport system ATP-binding protein